MFHSSLLHGTIPVSFGTNASFTKSPFLSLSVDTSNVRSFSHAPLIQHPGQQRVHALSLLPLMPNFLGLVQFGTFQFGQPPNLVHWKCRKEFDAVPVCHLSVTRGRSVFDGPPISHPSFPRVPGLYSAGVIQPRAM
jgi:hypothetical protein